LYEKIKYVIFIENYISKGDFEEKRGYHEIFN